MRSRRSGFPLRRYVSPWLLWLALLIPLAIIIYIVIRAVPL
mgnify:CR=1 FL=1